MTRLRLRMRPSRRRHRLLLIGRNATGVEAVNSAGGEGAVGREGGCGGGGGGLHGPQPVYLVFHGRWRRHLEKEGDMIGYVL